MNIAYFTDILSLHGFYWIRHFAAKHNVILICEQEPGFAEWYANKPRIKVYTILPTLYPLRNISQRKKAVADIRALLDQHQIDIVHSMYAMPYAYWGWHLRHPRHIVTTRGSDMLVDYKTRRAQATSLRAKITHTLLDRQTEKALNHARFITSTSEKQISVIKTFVRDHEKISCIRTGTDAESFLRFLDAAPAAKPGETLIFSNRALHPHYNIHLLIEAIGLLRKKRPAENIRLLTTEFGADPAYAEKVRALIQQLDLQNAIDIVPMASREQLAAFYKRSKIAVMAPFTDGTPVSGIEAMLARTPLLLPRIDYDQLFFSADKCWSFESFTAESIAAAIETILDTPENDRQAKTDRAFEAAFRHADTAKEMHKVELLYERMLKP